MKQSTSEEPTLRKAGGARLVAPGPFLVLLVAAVAGLVVHFSSWQHLLPKPLVDAQLRWHAKQTEPTGTLVVDIDDQSLAALQPMLGTWPYRRDIYAVVVSYLRQAGARAVVLDLVLADPRDGDQELASVIAGAGAPVILAAAGQRTAQMTNPSTSPAEFASADGSVPEGTALSELPALAWPDLVLPTTRLRNAVGQRPQIGVISAALDEDGVLRHLHLWHQAGNERWPSLPLAVWLATQPQQDRLPWPVDVQGRVTLALAADRDLKPPWPFATLVEAAVAEATTAALDTELAAAIKDKVVFIGSSGLLADRVMTPSGQACGNCALAQAFDALRDERTLKTLGSPAVLALMALMAAPAWWLLWRGRAQPQLDFGAAAVALGLLLLLATGAMYARLLVPLAAPLLVWLLSLLGCTLLHYLGSLREQRRLELAHAVALEANRAKSQFLANVSHEIRTPLNALLGSAELLADSSLTSTQRQQVQLLQNSGKSLRALIDELLDLSKIEAGSLVLLDEAFRLPRLLNRIVALMQPLIAAKGLQLIEDRGEDLPTWVRGDAQRLAQVLLKLLSNAVKFTDEGYIKLSVQRQAPDSQNLRFAISDSGIGIEPAQWESIFDTFAQVDGGMTRAYGGTGLGLPVARGLARQMNGEVSVLSSDNTGTVMLFVVRLPEAPAPPGTAPLAAATPLVEAALLTSSYPSHPLVQASTQEPTAQRLELATAPSEQTAAEPAAEPAAENTAELTSKHRSNQASDNTSAPPASAQQPYQLASARAQTSLQVLLAEDNAVNAYLFEAMLEGQDIELDMVTDGLQALDALRNRRYQIAFLDVQMPGMDGLSVARELRLLEARHDWPRTALVALTANAFESDVMHSLDAGCDLHVAKPFSRADLLEAVETLLPVKMLRPSVEENNTAPDQPSGAAP